MTNFIGDGFADTCQQNAYVSSSLTPVSEMLTACQQNRRPEKMRRTTAKSIGVQRSSSTTRVTSEVLRMYLRATSYY